MKLNIQLFNGDTQTVDTDVLSNVAKEFGDVGTAIDAWWTEFKKDVADVDNQDGFSTSSGSSYSQSVANVETQILEFIDACGGVSKGLANAVITYEDANTQVVNAIEEWEGSFSTAIQNVIGGLNSTMGKGDYPIGTYISEMSNSTRTILGEVAGMAQKTGDAFKSLTGTSIMGSVKTVFDWVASGDAMSIAQSFIDSINL